MYNEDPEKPSKKAQIERVEYIRAGQRFEIGDIEINPFSVTHDADEPVAHDEGARGLAPADPTDELGRRTEGLEVEDPGKVGARERCVEPAPRRHHQTLVGNPLAVGEHHLSGGAGVRIARPPPADVYSEVSPNTERSYADHY